MDRLRFIASGLWDFFRPLLAMLLTNTGSVLLRLAKEAVTIAEQTNYSGAEKRALAHLHVKTGLKAAGFEIGSSFINAAIEAAVVKLNEGK